MIADFGIADLGEKQCKNFSGSNLKTGLRNLKSAILLGTVFLALGFAVEAQQPKIPRIGFVSSSGASNDFGPGVEAFRRGLRDLGYIEGKTILVDYRYIEGDVGRIPKLL